MPGGKNEMRTRWLGRTTRLRGISVAALAGAVAIVLLGCGPPSKDEILEKSEAVATKAELRDALGAPDDRDKLGPVETWTYQASDGSVTFLITGDSVSLKSTSNAEPEPEEY
jgi:hypothetical protein